MCLAIPGKVISVEGNQAEVDFGGVVRKVNVSLVAQETLQLWQELLEHEATLED